MATQEAPAEGELTLGPASRESVNRLPEPAPQQETPVARVPADLVTVVVPAMNEERFIGPCLDSILSQDESNLQVLVVDGGSSDGTVAVVHQYAARDPRVEFLSAGWTIGSSLNAGLRAARGRWLVRVDAHSTIPPRYVSGLVDHLRTGEWGGVGGRKEGIATSPTGRAIAAALSSRFGVGNSVYHHGTRVRVVDHVPFGAYPTSLVRGVGGWDERLHANEDFELDYRLRRQGHRLLFDPGMAIEWQNRQTLGDLFRQYRRYGRGKAHVAIQHPGSVRPRHLAAPALVASWCLAGALALRWPWLAVLCVIPYPAGLLLASAITARKVQGWAARRTVPAAFLCMHVAWGIGFWEGVLTDVGTRLGARIRQRRPG